MINKFKKNKTCFIIILFHLFINNYLISKKHDGLEFKNIYGNEELKDENKEFIINIIKKFGMQGYNIKIYKMNDLAIKKFGCNNAFVYFNNMYISENFFESLTEGSKKFLIGHELIHIKKGHAKKVALLNIISLLSWLISSEFITSYINENCLSKSNKIVKEIGMRFIIFTINRALHDLFIAAFMRHCEKEADSQAALSLNVIEDGIKFLNEFLNEDQNKNKILAFINSFFSTHPSIKTRIKLLENIRVQHKAKQQGALT